MPVDTDNLICSSCHAPGEIEDGDPYYECGVCGAEYSETDLENLDTD